MSGRRSLLLVVVASSVLAVGACAPASSAALPGSGSATETSASRAAVSGTVTVFAAASLQEAFTTLKERFQAAHPGVTVRVSFGASSALAQAILQGSPVDVFASASQSTMDEIVRAGAASSSQAFARNTMEIAVPAANPAGITALADLARPGVKVALCQPQVPCGIGAARVFTNAKLAVVPVSHETDVKAVLTKVRLGEVDAGLVYVSDVRAAGDKVKGIDIPAEKNASTSYPIATLTSAPTPDAAAAFTAYVLSPEAGSVLAAAGFAAP